MKTEPQDNLYIHFSASEGLFIGPDDYPGHDAGLLYGSDQKDFLVVGPVHFVHVLFNCLRVATADHHDHHIAYIEDGFWRMSVGGKDYIFSDMSASTELPQEGDTVLPLTAWDEVEEPVAPAPPVEVPALEPHHIEDVTSMRETIEAAATDGPDYATLCLAGLDWLDTDEGKNYRHILSLWDSFEDAEYFDEWARRNPTLAAQYLAGIADVTGDSEQDRARAMYEYGFDLFDDVVEQLRGELAK